MKFLRSVIAALVLVFATAAAVVAQDATLGTLGAGVPGEVGPAGAGWKPPTGPAPRLPNGKPDFNGVWTHAYVPDMSRTNERQPAMQKGPGELPFTPAGRQNLQSYDPARDGDYTGMCMPFGLT